MEQSKVKQREKNLGTIKANVKVKTYFEFNQEVEIESLYSSCGCSKPIYNKSLNRVEVTYTPGSVPTHLREQGHYFSSKFITINYVDGTSEVVKLTAKITN